MTAHAQQARTLPALDSAKLAAPAIRAFTGIVERWKLSLDEQLTLLGNPPRSTFFKWKKDPEAANFGRDTLERISYILGIFKALQILLPEPERADAWIKKPNAATPFGGRSALDRMLSGNVSDLYVVRQYLDAMRGG
jgi:Protein of unknown function (DUF2384)